MDPVEILEYKKPGYKPVFKSENWLIACLNYLEEAEAENITTLEKHMLSEEFFLPLNGMIYLIFKTVEEKMEIIPLEKGRIYKVAKGTWHGLIMDKKSSCYIVKDNQQTKDVTHLTLSEKERDIIKNFSK